MCKKVFGENLADLRNDKKLKQGELASVLGISRDMLSNYERGKYTTPDDIKLKIARHFNVSLDSLMGLIDVQIPYDRKDAVFLPQGFPEEAIPKVIEYVDVLMKAHKAKK